MWLARPCVARLAYVCLSTKSLERGFESIVDVDQWSRGRPLPAQKEEALRLVGSGGVAAVELDYESGWQDAVELGRLGRAVGVRVEFRGHESIAIKSPAALVAGLARAKATFRQRNLYCQFDLDRLPAGMLEQLEAKATKLGDYILSGHLLSEVKVVWSE